MPRAQRLAVVSATAGGGYSNVGWAVWGTDVLVAGMLDAISDTISDEVIENTTENDETGADIPTSVKAEKHSGFGEKADVSAATGRLSGPQDVIVSSCSAFVASISYLMVFEDDTLLTGEKMPALIMAVFGGTLYAAGSVCTMTAFEQLPSTTVVPLSQISGPMVELCAFMLSKISTVHWLLHPFASSDLTQAKCAAFVLIFIGSMIPCASEMWAEDVAVLSDRVQAVVMVLVAQTCWTLFTLFMSCATSSALGTSHVVTSAQFVVLSNLVACVLVLLACALTRRGQRELRDLRKASQHVLFYCSVSEISNFLAIMYFSFAVKYYDNEGIVLAARLGLHQVSNFALASLLYYLCSFGRPPEYVGRKVVSAVLVCLGLYLTPS
eukprot:m.15473 g.15473  ORF g.15473 m.15473 type:complete len:382 (-) comp3271_c0_seq1:100-1245(-)